MSDTRLDRFGDISRLAVEMAKELFYSRALRAHEAPIPLERGYGRSLKHSARELRSGAQYMIIRRHAT